MKVRNFYFHFGDCFQASLHVIWGQEGSGNGPPHPGPHHPGPQNYENEGGQNERASMSFPSFPGFGGFGSFPFASMFGSGGSGASDANSPLGSSGMSGSQVPNPFSGFSSLFGNREQEIPAPGQPQDSAVSEHDDSDHPDHQNRLFFSLLSSRITSCNYTAQVINNVSLFWGVIQERISRYLIMNNFFYYLLGKSLGKSISFSQLYDSSWYPYFPVGVVKGD